MRNADRRLSRRYSVKIPIRFRGLGEIGESDEYTGETTNISRTGLFFSTRFRCCWEPASSWLFGFLENFPEPPNRWSTAPGGLCGRSFLRMVRLDTARGSIYDNRLEQRSLPRKWLKLSVQGAADSAILGFTEKYTNAQRPRTQSKVWGLYVLKPLLGSHDLALLFRELELVPEELVVDLVVVLHFGRLHKRAKRACAAIRRGLLQVRIASLHVRAH